MKSLNYENWGHRMQNSNYISKHNGITVFAFNAEVKVMY